MIDKLKWPLTLVVSIALAAMAAVILAGPALGIDEETHHMVMGWAKGIGAACGAVLFPLLAKMLAKDEDGDGIPDVLEKGGEE